jgi:hypothetical protein
MMNTTRRMVALTALTWLVLGGGAKGDLTYNVVDYTTITAPYTVSGTITTNGDLGAGLPTSDIIEWDITVTNGSTVLFDLTQNNSAVTLAPFNATETEINIDFSNSAIILRDNTGDEILWGEGGSASSIYRGETHTSTLWLGSLPSAGSPVATISTVPEPASLVLAGIGIGGVSVSVLVRKRRQQRRQAAA